MDAILVVSGPSGSGKTSLAKKMTTVVDNCYFSVSTTTRAPRNGEIEGVDYFFTTKEHFLERIVQGDFLEWAEVHGNFYGTSFSAIDNALKEKKLVVLDIDIQGHRNIKTKYNGIVTSVFITTESLLVLKERLSLRASETKESLEQRVINAFDEMKYICEYDYLLINENFNEALDVLCSIGKAASYKQSKFDLDSFRESWKN